VVVTSLVSGYIVLVSFVDTEIIIQKFQIQFRLLDFLFYYFSYYQTLWTMSGFIFPHFPFLYFSISKFPDFPYLSNADWSFGRCQIFCFPFSYFPISPFLHFSISPKCQIDSPTPMAHALINKGEKI